MAFPIGLIASLLGTAASASGGGGKPDAQGILGTLMNQAPGQGMTPGQMPQQGMAPAQIPKLSTPARPMFGGQPLGASPSSFAELAATAPPENPTNKWEQFVKGGGIGNAVRFASQFKGSGRRNQPPPWPMAIPQVPGLNPFDISRTQQTAQRPPLQNFGMSRFRYGRRA